MPAATATYLSGYEIAGNSSAAVWDYAWKPAWRRRVETEGLVEAGQHECEIVHRREGDVLGLLERGSDLLG